MQLRIAAIRRLVLFSSQVIHICNKYYMVCRRLSLIRAGCEIAKTDEFLNKFQTILDPLPVDACAVWHRSKKLGIVKITETVHFTQNHKYPVAGFKQVLQLWFY